MKRSPHFIGLRPEATARQALTLCPPIRMGAERGHQAGRLPIQKLVVSAAFADWKSAIQQTGSLRYAANGFAMCNL